MSVDPERTIEQQRRHITLLHQLCDVLAAMSAAATPDEVATAMLTRGLRVLEADAGYLAVLDADGRTLRVSRFAGYDAIPVEQLELPVDANLPIAHAVRMRTSVFIGSNEQLLLQHPGVARMDDDDHACASIPLLAGEDELPLGAINLRFDTPREFSEMDRRLFALLGEHCSTAMVRAQRFADEQRRRIAAEDALTTSRALEINDDIVQLLAEAKLAAQLGLEERAVDALDRAMAASKRVVATMTRDAVAFRRDALTLEGILRVGATPGESATTASTTV